MIPRLSAEYAAQLTAARAFIEQRDDFLVVSHVNPDGDAASSTLAVGWLLRQLGKRYIMMNAGRIPAKFLCLPEAERIVDFSAVRPPHAFETVITIDCADFARIGPVSEVFAGEVKLLNIDHHPTNDRFGTVALVKEDAAATVEILYDLAKHFGFELQREFAEVVYTGLLTDTGGFRYANASPKVLQIASEMLEYGVNGSELADRFLEKMTMAQIELLRRALATLRF